jgi:predicted Zn-dependent peptidase
MKSIFLIFLAFIFSQNIFTNETYSQVSEVTSGRFTYTTVEDDPLNARIYTLGNGLKVYMSVNKDAPRIQTFIAVRAGSKHDPSDATGLAHYLEHMLFKGTDRYGTLDAEKEIAEINKVIELYEVYRNTTGVDERKRIYAQIDSISQIASQYAIANEFDKMLSLIGAKGTNAYTWVEQTVYTNDIPSNQLANWLTIEAERFRNPVMRLFHTELEVVYEEKNRSLDNDNNKVWEVSFAELFPTHQYGTQTTIGTIEHLKNPSIKKVIDYYNTYYVPNNMAIAISGDFDPDNAIRLIDEKFGGFQSKPVPKFIPAVEAPITSPVIKTVIGPDAESVRLAYRFDAANSEDARKLEIMDNILANGTAGLIDLNLNQQQKVLSAGSFPLFFEDYSAYFMTGRPREGQSLEEVKDLLIQQIELVKKGEFPDWLMDAVINNLKLERIRSLESNQARANAFVSAFILGMPWEDYVKHIDNLSRYKKDDIVRFANEKFRDNYVAVYKRTGEDPNILKVEKPQITPVNVNRESESEFVNMIANTQTPDIQPVFIDYDRDIERFNLRNDVPVLYTRNNLNELFNLYYVLDMGTNNDKKLSMAINYLQYLGTSEYTPSQLKEEFYKIGSSFGVFSSEDRVYVSLSGLDENFDRGLELFESLLADPQPNREALENLIQDVLKQRENNKLNKSTILWSAMLNYGKYGAHSPFTNVLSEAELKALNPEELISILKQLLDYRHTVLYYGPRSTVQLTQFLDQHHRIPDTFKPYPPAQVFAENISENSKVYVVDYDMVQAEILMLAHGEKYNRELAPLISVFNEYFGSGMSSVVFQELRESKALAYSVFSSYSSPAVMDKPYTIYAYVGTQADKLGESMEGIFALMENMPESPTSFSSAKNSVLQKIQTDRVTKTDILFNYLNSKKLGLEYDIRKDIYTEVPLLTIGKIKEFHDRYVSGLNYNIMVLGDRDKLDMNVLNQYGEVKFLTLDEIFGYR